MAEIETGGPAFPAEGGEASGLHPNPGMTLRDYFAGQALAGIFAGGYRSTGDNIRDMASGVMGAASPAKAAYAIADALLTERAKGGQ